MSISWTVTRMSQLFSFHAIEFISAFDVSQMMITNPVEFDDPLTFPVATFMHHVDE